MTTAAIAAIAYGALSIVGGIIGFVQAGSKVSLISGLISGILLIAGAMLIRQGNAAGFFLSLIVTAGLIAVFAVRLAKTRKAMPAGLMIIAGIAALAVMLLGG